MKTMALVAGFALTVSALGMAVYPAMDVSAGGVKFQAFTNLLPPSPLPEGVAPNGHGRAQLELEPGIKERLKLDIDDVEVIGDAADPEFCRGFYEVVLSDTARTMEFGLPSFPGIITVCLVAGDAQGPTRGSLNFDAKLNKGETAINPQGMLLSIWEVAPVRDPLTGVALPGPNGEPFMIESRIAVALEGVLQ